MNKKARKATEKIENREHFQLFHSKSPCCCCQEDHFPAFAIAVYPLQSRKHHFDNVPQLRSNLEQ